MEDARHTARPCIVAMGGGGFMMEPDNPLLDDWLLSLTGKERPRVCLLPTASGDSDRLTVTFHEAFGGKPCKPTALSLFRRRHADLRSFVLDQDLLYVGGGNTANMLAIWRVHGLDVILKEAWEAGVVLCGLSAGSLCWYEAGITDSFGPELAPLLDGLGFLAGSHCPHHDGEPQREPRYRRFVADGSLPGGIAADDGVALRYHGRELVEIVSSRRQAGALKLSLDAGGDLIEERLSVRFLGQDRVR